MKNLDSSPLPGNLIVVFSPGGETVLEFNSFLKSGWFSVLIVKHGSFEFGNGQTVVSVGPQQMYAIPESYLLRSITGSSWFCLVCCSLPLAINGRIVRYSSGYLDTITSRSGILLSLSERELENMLEIAALLEEKVVIRELSPFGDEIAVLCLNLLLYEYVALCHRQAGGLSSYRAHSEKIALAFIGMLDEHARDRHDVRFYADALCVSDGHLRKCVRLATGMPAKYFIEAALLSESYLLLADRNLSITEVSEQLRFGTLSSFSNFFRKYAGLSPSEYRTRLQS